MTLELKVVIDYGRRYGNKFSKVRSSRSKIKLTGNSLHNDFSLLWITELLKCLNKLALRKRCLQTIIRLTRY